MIALLQRVGEASVTVNDEMIASIGKGLLVLLGVERGDDQRVAERLCERVVGYRLFADAQGRMNLDLRATGGALLVVPQFTLAADTRKGLRPSFTGAAVPEQGQALFEHFLNHAATMGVTTEAGEFGAEMAVQLVNDGPVTFWLQLPPAGG